jgi:hypothetical protein
MDRRTLVRLATSRVVVRRPWTVDVPVGSLLQGGQAGLSAAEFAGATGDLLWASTRVANGAHVALLRAALGRLPDELDDEQILCSDYGLLARRCILAREHFYGAHDSAGIVALARATVARHLGRQPALGRPPDATPPGGPILVAPIAGTPLFQVLDGHHRVAGLIAAGRAEVPVIAKWWPVSTPLQELVEAMNGRAASRELLQPLAFPELAGSWRLVSRCDERLRAMLALLELRGLLPPVTSSYLDVGSSYGWFVARMRDAGFSTWGIEADPLAQPLGAAAYELDPARIATGPVSELLADHPVADVVSCFDVGALLGPRAGSGVEEVVRLLDRVTGRVLFVEPGRAGGFHTDRTWNVHQLESQLRRHAGFDRIVNLDLDLGPTPPTTAPDPTRHRIGATHPEADPASTGLLACIRLTSDAGPGR